MAPEEKIFDYKKRYWGVVWSKMVNTDRTVGTRVDDLADNPYLKVLARLAMIFVTFIAAPVIYWVITTLLAVNTNLATIVLIQQNQQQQVQKVVDTTSSIISTQATEAQARAVSDAQFDVQIKTIREDISHTNDQLDRQGLRIDDLARRVYDGKPK